VEAGDVPALGPSIEDARYNGTDVADIPPTDASRRIPANLAVGMETGKGRMPRSEVVDGDR
jgi:hypothetical protein